MLYEQPQDPDIVDAIETFAPTVLEIRRRSAVLIALPPGTNRTVEAEAIEDLVDSIRTRADRIPMTVNALIATIDAHLAHAGHAGRTRTIGLAASRLDDAIARESTAKAEAVQLQDMTIAAHVRAGEADVQWRALCALNAKAQTAAYHATADRMNAQWDFAQLSALDEAEAA